MSVLISYEQFKTPQRILFAAAGVNTNKLAVIDVELLFLVTL